MIQSPEAVQLFIDALNEEGVAYLVTGSLVSNAYGEPRVTYDADFLIEAAPDAMAQVARRLGSDFERDAQLSFETVTGKVQHKFLHRPSGLLLEAFELSDDAHDQKRFARRRQVLFLDRMTWFPTPEDVVVQKLRWYALRAREKDMRDVIHVIARQHDALDWPYVEQWCREHGSAEHLAAARAAAAELDA